MKHLTNITRGLTVTALAAALALSGCANMSETQTDSAKGAGIGAPAGVLLGAATGGSKGAAQGAVLGAGAGAHRGWFPAPAAAAPFARRARRWHRAIR